MKIIPLITLLFLSTFLSAQITVEQTFYNSANITEVSPALYKIIVMDDVNNQLKIYNLDYSIWKTIPITVPTGKYLYDIKFVTQKLFNTDNNIEFVYILSEYINNSYYEYTTIVANEMGNELLNVPKGSFINVINANGSAKLIIWTYDYSTYPYVINTKFYSLTGSLPSKINTLNQQKIEIHPYPVPAKNYINIPYTLTEKSTNDLLIISDSKGTLKENIQLKDSDNYFKLNTSKYKSGIYFYKIQSKKKEILSGKFIIKR